MLDCFPLPFLSPCLALPEYPQTSFQVLQSNGVGKISDGFVYRNLLSFSQLFIISLNNLSVLSNLLLIDMVFHFFGSFLSEIEHFHAKVMFFQSVEYYLLNKLLIKLDLERF